MLSRPMRARGLKLVNVEPEKENEPSRPMRARGLKLYLIGAGIYLYSRAPCGRVD